MQNIILDKDFQYLLPMLDEKTYSDLETDILENGIRDPLVLWNDILIDGYNRFSIAQKHDLPFETVTMEFNSRDDVMIWMIRNQILRRNLTPYQLRYFRGLHYHAVRRTIKNDEGINQHDEVKRQNGVKPQSLATSKVLAEKYKVSPRTIERDSKLADVLIAIGEISPEAKQNILLGEIKVTRKELEEILSSKEDDITEIIGSIEDGTYDERRSEPPQTNKQSLEFAFSKISNSISRELNGLTKAYKLSEVRAALKSHIKTLEDLYANLR
ncbi:MAG: hypothetical protein LBC73_04550 [Oscillospiraceae bacterium]|jgi:hypothetical protein|nr:hypothetical protein [Oscillospiraceae bacterium]